MVQVLTYNTRDRLTASGTLTLTSGTLDASGSYVIRAGNRLANVRYIYPASRFTHSYVPCGSDGDDHEHTEYAAHRRLNGKRFGGILEVR